MPEKIVNINVRFPESLRDRVKTSADRDRRSMNSEILTLLEEALDARATGRREPGVLRCAESPAPYDPT